jgi:hypothetical protein
VNRLKATYGIATAAAALAFATPAAADFTGEIGDFFNPNQTTTISVAGMPDVFITAVNNGDPGGGGVNGEMPGGASAFPDNIDLDIGYDSGPGLYFFDMSDFVNNLPLDDTYALQYYIDIDGWFSPDQLLRLGLVRAGMNVTANNERTFTKHVVGVTPDPNDPTQNPSGPPDNWSDFGVFFDEELTTTGGNFASIFCGRCTRFLVTDVLVNPASVTGTLSSLTNNYNLVPAPASLALLGSGLALLGFSRRRNRKGA